MDTKSIVPPTRELRGIRLYRDHADEIERVYPGVYRVPSCSGSTAYTVHLAPRERCECPDFERHGEPCKHVYAAGVAASKTRRRQAPLASA